MAFKELIQSADWKNEKHVPVIDAPAVFKKSGPTRVTVTVGKGIAHPNTSEHHIAWTALYFLPDGEKHPAELGRFRFSAHGLSAQGPNTSTVYTEPDLSVLIKTEKPGTLIAVAMCNIHGLWENSQKISVE